MFGHVILCCAASALAVPQPTFRTVALDMDGTLLNKRHALSEASVASLRSLSDRGIDIALCSGRSAPAMRAAATELALSRPMPMVSYNGALGLLTRAPGWTTTSTELFTSPVPEDAVTEVLRVAEDHGLLVQYYYGDHIYVVCKTDEHVQLTERYVELTGVAAHVHEESYARATALGAPYKMLVMGDAVDETLALLHDALPEGLVKLIRGSPPFFVEVLHPAVDKGEGLRRMCEALGTPLNRVTAFGDGDNDIEFVRDAGLGWVMSNARPGSPIWDVADRSTTASNDDDGVAKALGAMEAAGELATCAHTPRVVRGEVAKAHGLVVRRGDVDEVLPLRRAVLWPNQPEMCRLSDDDEAIHLVATREAADETAADGSSDGARAVLGVASLCLPAVLGSAGLPSGRAQLRKLAVDEAWRGHGLGSTLIDVAAAEARCAGAAKLFLHAREAQAAFYVARGFERCGEPFDKYVGGELYVPMEIRL